MSTEVIEQTDRLVLRRLYQTSIDAMWAAWTEPDRISQWFGCGSTQGVAADLDVREGGNFTMKMTHDEGGCFSAKGRYTEVTPKTKLAYTWEWDTEDPNMQFGETLVEVEFKEIGDSVELNLTHSGFPSAELVPMHNQGWSAGLEKLSDHVQQ